MSNCVNQFQITCFQLSILLSKLNFDSSSKCAIWFFGRDYCYDLVPMLSDTNRIIVPEGERNEKE